jgi:hypothetical protein
MPVNRWKALVSVPFGYLTRDFGCGVAGHEDNSWVTTLIYQNETTAVKVTYSIEFDRAEVSLVRLIKGRRPAYPIFISEQEQLHHFLLDNLLLVRAPEALDAIKPYFSLKEEAVKEALSRWADALRKYGSGPLNGDFSVFDEMEATVRARVRDHPEQITVWLPEETSADEENQERERLRAIHPQIPVILRRYRRAQRKGSGI